MPRAPGFSLEYIQSHCARCQHRQWEKTSGLLCGKGKPQNADCNSFSADAKIEGRMRYKAEKDLVVEKKARFWRKLETRALIAVLIILGGFYLYFKVSLDLNYRYAVAKVVVRRQSGGTSFFGRGKYRAELHYRYVHQGDYFYAISHRGGRWGMSKPIWPTQGVVKYNPDNPKHHELYLLSEIDLEDLPEEIQKKLLKPSAGN